MTGRIKKRSSPKSKEASTTSALAAAENRLLCREIFINIFRVVAYFPSFHHEQHFLADIRREVRDAFEIPGKC